MTNNKQGNETKWMSFTALEAVSRGRAITKEGYMWTGTTPKDGSVMGVSLFDTAIGEGISVATADGDEVIYESGAAVTAGATVYTDSVGRATTVSSAIELGVANEAASAAGEELRVIQRLVN